MRHHNTFKLAAATLAIIGAGTVFFNIATDVVMAAETGKIETVPTSYQVSDSLASALSKPEQKKENSGEVNYRVSMDELNTGTPTDVDMTMEEAAEVGAGYLRNIFGLDLKGAYVYLSYYPGTETFPRAFWSADVLFEEARSPESTRWSYMIDAVTGELFNAGYGRQLDANPSLGYDEELAKDCGLYMELAKKKVEECGLMDGPVDRVEYNCQGYSGNDPTITMDVIGKRGEIVNMSFSRYDQVFLGLITDTSLRIAESALDDLAGEVEVESVGYGSNGE